LYACVSLLTGEQKHGRTKTVFFVGPATCSEPNVAEPGPLPLWFKPNTGGLRARLLPLWAGSNRARGAAGNTQVEEAYALSGAGAGQQEGERRPSSLLLFIYMCTYIYIDIYVYVGVGIPLGICRMRGIPLARQTGPGPRPSRFWRGTGGYFYPFLLFPFSVSFL